jgi:hypothetical protein
MENKHWLQIEEEFKKRYGAFEICDKVSKSEQENILNFFKPYFQENLHEEAKEELEMDCQWENCSGGQYCENHSLERRPESSWKEEFDNLSDYRFVNDQNRKEMKYFISKVEKEAYERGRNSVDNVSK